MNLLNLYWSEVETSVEIQLSLSLLSMLQLYVGCNVMPERNLMTSMFFNYLAGLDYSYTREVITFQPGDTGRVINISILDDKVFESDEIFIAVFTFKLFQHSATVTILDLDGKRNVLLIA